METLPVEMVLKIGHKLTPEDLARCCAVSKGWREAFNEDCLWKPHCDPELEEHLRTTPSIVEPAFVTPGGEDSTLAPVSQWRLAFLKEKHLWNNWKHNNHKTEKLVKSVNEIAKEFLTNTLIVRWYTNHFEIWDVSVIPAVFVAKTDPSVVDITDWIACSVADKSLLVVEQIASVKVFHVDILNKCIQLKQEIVLDDVKAEPADSSYIQVLRYFGSSDRTQRSILDCINGSLLVHVNVTRLKLDIFDLETGMKVKEEPCPVVRNGGERLKIDGIRTSANSDYAVVVVKSEPEVNSPGSYSVYHYIYCLKTLCFLPGPLLKKGGRFPDYGELYQHYYAANDKNNSFTIYDCRSREVLLRHSHPMPDPCLVFNDSFIVKEFKYDYDHRGCLDMLRLFTPSSKTSTIIRKHEYIKEFKVFNNKFLVTLDPRVGWYYLLGNVWVKCDISFGRHTDINRAFTKVLTQDLSPAMHPGAGGFYVVCTRWEEHFVHHYW